MPPTSSDSPTSLEIRGIEIPGADNRQVKIRGFDQRIYSQSHVVCIGAGGLGSHIAPTLVRKGIGAITLLDDDRVEVSNLNRQRFYREDLGKSKALALVRNLQAECIAATLLRGVPNCLEDHVAAEDIECDVAVCGVDNNPTRVFASRYFRALGIPIILTAVSIDGDYGYVFVQETAGPCFGCLFPDAVNSNSYPCPGTPAIADILQAVGALAVYSVDTILMSRPREWNFRTIRLSGGSSDASAHIPIRGACPLRENH